MIAPPIPTPILRLVMLTTWMRFSGEAGFTRQATRQMMVSATGQFTTWTSRPSGTSGANRYRIPIRGQVVDLSQGHRKFIGIQGDPRT